MRTRAGWSDASGYTISDLTMLRKELVAGFVIGGFASALVPTWFWRSLFVTGHGFWSSLQNVVLGPFLALISFVCSIGNVPIAAALWRGGISFGGVISFVFADLITLPLLLIYRKYFGTAITLRLLAAFWVDHERRRARHRVPREGGAPGAEGRHSHRAAHPRRSELHNGAQRARGDRLRRPVLAVSNPDGECDRHRVDRYAKDPVCGMQVEKALAPARLQTRIADGLLLLRPLLREVRCGELSRHSFLTICRKVVGQRCAVRTPSLCCSVICS